MYYYVTSNGNEKILNALNFLETFEKKNSLIQINDIFEITAPNKYLFRGILFANGRSIAVFI